MTKEQTELFFEKLKCADIKNPEYQISYLYGVLALILGAREQTILNIRIKDINFKEGEIKLYNFKTDTRYLGHIASDDVEKILKNIINFWKNSPIKEGSEYLFRVLKTGSRYKKAPNGVRNTLDRYINQERDETEIITVRDLRNVLATRLINEGVPLSFIQNLLFHKTSEMTTRYAQLLKKLLEMNLKRYLKE